MRGPWRCAASGPSSRRRQGTGSPGPRPLCPRAGRPSPPPFYVKAKVRVHEYPNGPLAVFHGPRRLACYTAQGEPIEKPDKKAA